LSRTHWRRMLCFVGGRKWEEEEAINSFLSLVVHLSGGGLGSSVHPAATPTSNFIIFYKRKKGELLIAAMLPVLFMVLVFQALPKN
jgi:hypothetical protein